MVKPMFIQTIFDRGKNTKEDWYDTNWNLLDVNYFSPIKNMLKKPKLLEHDVNVAKNLSSDFPLCKS